MKNPFAKPSAVSRHLKIAVTGKAGVGKTVFGLDAKNHSLGPVAVLSNEAGDVHYLNSPKWGGFDRLPTQSLAVLDEALTFLEQNPGQYGTLVVDTVTGVYEGLVDAKSKEDGSVAMRDWGLIKRKWKSIMARLNNLPVNIVAVVHENDIVEVDSKGASKIVGQKLDAEKTFERNPDVLIRLGMVESRRVARVLKDRTMTFQAGEVINDPHIGMWVKAIKGGAAEERVAPPEEVAAANEAAMATGPAESASRTLPHGGASEWERGVPSVEKQIEQAHTALVGDVLKLIDEHEEFNHEAHANNWWKQQWPLIGKLAVADQKAIRAKLNAKIKKNGNGAKETAQ